VQKQKYKDAQIEIEQTRDMVFDLKSQKADVEYEKQKPGTDLSELKVQ
jgi:hypothetical protein